MFGKVALIYWLFTAITVASGQQYFQKKGDHYNAKVSIHRETPRGFDVSVGQPSQQLYYRQSGYRGRPWRQGDRITKDEVVQNLARALLSRKMSTEDMKNDKQKTNEEKLREYTLYQSRIAQGQNVPPHGQSPPTNPPPTAEPNPGLSMGQRSQGQPAMMGRNTQFLPPQDQKRRSSLKAQGSHFSKRTGHRLQRSYAGTKTREFMKPNSIQTK